MDERTINRQRKVRDAYYQEYLRTEDIEIDGVVGVRAELSQYVRMAVVTTAKRADFELIHQGRQITPYMDFVLVREDYTLAKPDPKPYLTGLKRFGAHGRRRPSATPVATRAYLRTLLVSSVGLSATRPNG